MPITIADIDSRDAFFDELLEIAHADPQVIFLTADMGAFSLERFKKELPRQYFNVGVAEQNMVSVAAGLALGGKKVFIYSIVPFATLRCYEQIKIDLCCMRLPVVIVGIGAGVMYGGDGPTHHALHDVAVMQALPEMTIYNPADAATTAATARLAYRAQGGPVYIRLEKGRLPELFNEPDEFFAEGLAVVREGSDATVIASGIMVHQALQAAETLFQEGISLRVIDLYRVKPLNSDRLLTLIPDGHKVVTLEENSLVGGIGSTIAALFSDAGRGISLKRLAFPDKHFYEACSREEMHALYGLDAPGIGAAIKVYLRDDSRTGKIIPPQWIHKRRRYGIRA